MKTVRLLFSDDMARAIVQGRKTVTRRPVMAMGPQAMQALLDSHGGRGWPCAPGDILIGRECVSFIAHGPEYGCRAKYRSDGVERVFDPAPNADLKYRPVDGWKCMPSIHMPDWAARIRRRVVSVTVERLQDISEADAVREGFATSEELEEFFRNCAPPGSRMARPLDTFEVAWDGIYAAKGLGWDSNCWVWRIEFERENVQEASNGR